MSGDVLQFLIPGDLSSATGGYVYDRHVIGGLRQRGWQVEVHLLDGSFPDPSSAALAHADSVLRALPDAALVLIDGLALSAMPGLIEQHAGRLEIVALVHMPLCSQSAGSVPPAPQLQECERRALRAARHAVVTSHTSAQLVAALGLPRARISVVEPGTDAAAIARRRYDGTLRLLCVATLSEGKGHELLLEALLPLTDLPWQLCCVGSLTRSPGTVERLRSLLQRSPLEHRVQLVGERPHEELTAYYAGSDLFVLPTLRESYCMAVAEALAHALPVISTRTGAIAQLVGKEAGIVLEPGDAGALHAALSRVLQQPALAQRLAQGALRARARLRPWASACAELDAVLSAVRRAASACATECAR